MVWWCGGPGRSGREGGGAEREAPAGPGEVVRAGGDGQGRGRAVRGGRAGPGGAEGAAPARSHLCGRGTRRELLPQRGDLLPAVPGAEDFTAAFIGHQAPDTRPGAAAASPPPPLRAPCAPAPAGSGVPARRCSPASLQLCLPRGGTGAQGVGEHRQGMAGDAPVPVARLRLHSPGWTRRCCPGAVPGAGQPWVQLWRYKDTTKITDGM